MALCIEFQSYLTSRQKKRPLRSVTKLRHNGAYLDSLGWAYFKLDHLDLAEMMLQQASEQMAWNSVIQDHFGDLMLKLERYGDAIAAWERALAGDGDEVEVSSIEQKIGDARRRLERQ